jgi:DNA modification methylase
MTKPAKPSRSRDGVYRDLHVEERPIGSLKPAGRNARTHSKKQIHQIAASIREFGFTNPILVDENGEILAGHGRLAGAKELGLAVVPTIRLDHLSAEQKRAYILADNKLALNAGWDPEILEIEFAELSAVDLAFELEITGFSTAEIDGYAEGAKNAPAADDDIVPEVQSSAVSRPGDLWLLGSHKLLCGDSRDPASFATVMGSDRAQLVFSDAPYNVKIDGHVGGAGAVKHREFAMASGEMTRAEFIAFLQVVFRNLAAVSVDGSLHFQCMDWRHSWEMLAAGEAVYSELKNICVWVKDNGGMGSLYRSQHEMVFVWKVGDGAHVNTIELGKHGRYRTNVWEYAGVNTLKRDRMTELAMHPTVKPCALVQDAIKDASKKGDIVLDPFSGSGTTLIAAEKTRRKGRAIEFDPIYVDVAVRRWQGLTGKKAVLLSSGTTFEEIEDERINGWDT